MVGKVVWLRGVMLDVVASRFELQYCYHWALFRSSGSLY